MGKMTKWTAHNLVAVAASLTKTGGETIKAAYIPEGLTKSLLIFKPKRLTLLFKDWFLGMTHQVNTPPLSRCPLCQKASRLSPTHPIHRLSP